MQSFAFVRAYERKKKTAEFIFTYRGGRTGEWGRNFSLNGDLFRSNTWFLINLSDRKCVYENMWTGAENSHRKENISL